ncbi:hypothetical protein ABZX74_15345 [Streptomyces olivaceoviridis]|uniref:hypothetical protein n=1 Tax=Streptomyces olivaceoviridis TaxID=1921 RepID=UPI0033B84875
MFVARTRFDRVVRLLDGETRRRQEAEDKAARQTVTIQRLQSQVAHDQDEHPTTPVPVQPATGDARLVQQLALSERARKALDERVLELHRANMHQEHELTQLREQLAALQTVPGVAS